MAKRLREPLPTTDEYRARTVLAIMDGALGHMRRALQDIHNEVTAIGKPAMVGALRNLKDDETLSQLQSAFNSMKSLVDTYDEASGVSDL